MTLRAMAEVAASEIIFEQEPCVANIADAIESVARAFAERALKAYLDRYGKEPDDYVIKAAIDAAEVGE